MVSRVLGRLWFAGCLVLVPTLVGCQITPERALSGPADQVVYRGFSGSPRVRFGSYPSSNIGTFFKGPDLGTHGYRFRLSEKNGIAYTCRGGHIDVIHVRIAADWTAYLTATTYRHLMERKSGFSCKLAVDRSRSYVTFSYPEDWDRRSKVEQMAIAREVAMAVGPYLAWTLTTWHEMLTWYGFKCIGPFPEYPSAFSWEDSYSNLLGTIIAIRALNDSEHSYNDAVKIALDQEMQRLGVQPAHVARQASESVRGKWFTGNVIFQVNMMKRNFDIGLENGYLTPTLVPDVAQCPDAEPMLYPIPRLAVLREHGFSMKMEIEPHEWERGKLLRIVHDDKRQKRIDPEEHFPILMRQIRLEAANRYGPEYHPDQSPVPPKAYTAR
ncbi:MAG: DUF4056 domain-containing protein [Planctomycetes bacterium]|nr:DUF4056 domain-containing protein [Planctomycetota bacterium]